jgi:2-methylaconitate cis-trans-isomerase PrpF
MLWVQESACTVRKGWFIVSITLAKPCGAQRSVPAVFMRGGTSKGVFFHARDLPENQQERDRLFLTVIGSPDAYGRQLDGMGGGLSSLSKVVIVGLSTRPDADVDYTFAQVAVNRSLVDYGATCGNLASAVGPFALDEGLVRFTGSVAEVRIHSVNTGKLIRSHFGVQCGSAAVSGTLALPGVAGTGAPIRLDFLDPAGGATGSLLPSRSPTDVMAVPERGAIEVSMVDAATACVFVRACDLGLMGNEGADELDANAALMQTLEHIRCLAGVRMGLRGSIDEMRFQSPGSPKVAIVAPPQSARLLDGSVITADRMDVNVRMLSMGQAHRAVPLTGALCLAVAAKIEGTVVAETARPGVDLRVGTPSGVFPVSADVTLAREWRVSSASVYRTARRLMEGRVLVPRGT